MTSVFSLKSGILAALTIEQTAFEQFTTPQRTPLVPKKKEIHYRDAFIKIYTGVDHGNFTDAGGDLPDIQKPQPAT
ncbi:hypothetical protein Daus18300_014289 [Diaporthe australafricana]|uniref:Uncharacterized protein n=1 Tax=Diaporthe australafricana TaxID=127596 RepID=A0ABR3VVR7_9PEZI